jgi:hypothetical protein
LPWAIKSATKWLKFSTVLASEIKTMDSLNYPAILALSQQPNRLVYTNSFKNDVVAIDSHQYAENAAIIIKD